MGNQKKFLRGWLNHVPNRDLHGAVAATREIVRDFRDGERGGIFGRWIRSRARDANASRRSVEKYFLDAAIRRDGHEEDGVRGEGLREASANEEGNRTAGIGEGNRPARKNHFDEDGNDLEAD